MPVLGESSTNQPCPPHPTSALHHFTDEPLGSVEPPCHFNYPWKFAFPTSCWLPTHPSAWKPQGFAERPSHPFLLPDPPCLRSRQSCPSLTCARLLSPPPAGCFQGSLPDHRIALYPWTLPPTSCWLR